METNGILVEDGEKPDARPGDPAASSPSLRSEDHNAKAVSILDACKWRDIATLRTLATSEGGLVSDEVRRQACQCYHGSLLCETDRITGPLLLGYIDTYSELQQLEKEVLNDWRTLPKHRDEDQVRLDVDRSFIYYPNGGSWP